ncbi:pretoxin HINT domain-containing protein [Murinocardiopsis flavida]|uniref:Pretoxin HINT domain-containing protein n=1 Tax=Murinocardiopsis flavida TaxID=645275 RepID=A0A2P8CQV4_9ACTN|nr:Hint domain-containing protein [Murinocardiopsis flavida]PSK87347.1 pretoxin HINT domain-containing protein [Murinocardiopsis flavida]
MRWVRRAESGASILEYAAVVVLISTIAAALIAGGLPSAVTPAVTGAVCELYDAGHCDDKKGGGENGGSGGSAADPGGSGADDPTEAASPSGGGPAADPAADKKLKDAQKEYDRLKRAQKRAQADADGFDEELLAILSDMIGATDAKKCFTEGDIIACAKTAAGSLGVFKAARALTKVPKAISAFNKMRKASKALDKANDRLNKQKKKLDALKKKRKQRCTRAGGKKNSFLPGTPVLMADGTHVPIEDVAVGDKVLAFDPRTGEEGSRPVTDLIEGSGKKALVALTVISGDGSVSRLTATGEHPFWSPDSAEWIDADDLRPGDRLRTAEGEWAEVRAVGTRTAADQAVHNLTIADLHTYYAGESGQELLVHNDDPTPEDPCSTAAKVAKQVDDAKDSVLSKIPGAEAKLAKGGWNIKVPYKKNQPITIRIMQGTEGNARHLKPYFRISAGNKGAVDKNGVPTSDRAASHMDLVDGSPDEIAAIVTKLKGGS